MLKKKHHCLYFATFLLINVYLMVDYFYIIFPFSIWFDQVFQ